ncbi:MAG: GTPase RsgA, partial [Deltaproteobacteria bacterium]
CRFRDCTHSEEPGCAVRAAAESGELPPERLASYHKLLREAQLVAAKSDARLKAAESRKAKIMGRAIKDYHKRTGRG